MNNISVLAIITARGGSKSIPKKNIKELCGEPLIAYTIKEAHKSRVTRTILSTDSEEIAHVGRSYGCEVPFLRPAEISGDKSTSIEAVQHALNFIRENEGVTYDYVLILQPTSPFRIAEDIDASIRIAEQKDADSVMGMVALTDFSPKKLKRINTEDLITPLFEAEGKTSGMRQEDQGVYKRNAAIYLTKTGLIMGGDLFGERSYAYVMSEDRSVDINTQFDFEFAEYLMKKKKHI